MNKIDVVEVGVQEAYKIKDSLCGPSAGNKKFRVTFEGMQLDTKYHLSASKTKPFFSSRYIEVQDRNNKSWWINKRSFKRRFSTNSVDLAFLETIFPGIKRKAPILHAMSLCSKTVFDSEKVKEILQKAKEISAYPHPISVILPAKQNKIARTILTSGPSDNGKRQQHLLMTHVKKGNDKLVGQGSFGKAKGAIRIDTGDVDIVKTSRASTAGEREQLEREIDIMNEMRGTKNVVQLYYSCQYAKEKSSKFTQYYLVMENCDKGSLSTQLLKRAITPEQAIQYAYDIVFGLEEVHKRSYIHQDLKEENILIKSEKKRSIAKIGDFGLASTNEKGITLAGTPSIFSPEKCKLGLGQAIDQHSTSDDVWALGTILYRLFHPKASSLGHQAQLDRGLNTGSFLTTTSNLEQNTIDEQCNKASANPAVQELLKRALQVDPTKRASLEEIKKRLTEIAQDQNVDLSYE